MSSEPPRADSPRQNGKHTVFCRGVRGATTSSENTAEAIIDATTKLLCTIVDVNDMKAADVASIFFSVTPELDAAFPALATRALDARFESAPNESAPNESAAASTAPARFSDCALLCVQEIPVAEAPERCIRILVHWNTDRPAEAIEHIYLEGAVTLRRDRAWPRPGSNRSKQEGKNREPRREG